MAGLAAIVVFDNLAFTDTLLSEISDRRKCRLCKHRDDELSAYPKARLTKKVGSQKRVGETPKVGSAKAIVIEPIDKINIS